MGRWRLHTPAIIRALVALRTCRISGLGEFPDGGGAFVRAWSTLYGASSVRGPWRNSIGEA